MRSREVVALRVEGVRKGKIEMGKKLRKFEAVRFMENWTLVLQCEGGLKSLLDLPSKSAAKKLADAFNREYRAITFRPKSQGSRARKKGHQFERDVAIALRAVYPKARRHLEYQDAEANGVDLVETGPFKIQCKKYKTYAPLSAIKEVNCERELGDIPVLVTAGDGEEPLAALPFGDFLTLIRALEIVQKMKRGS